MAPRSPVMLTPDEAGQMAGLSAKTIYRQIAAGNLRAIRIGRAWRISYPALGEWLGIDLPTPDVRPLPDPPELRALEQAS